MYLRDLGATLRRRWYLTIAGLIATIGLCVASLSLYPASYQAQANIVLLPPASTVAKGGNPYLQLGNLSQVVDVMIRALNAQSAVEEVAATAPTGTYEVSPDYTTSSPIFIITAFDQTPEATLATLKTVSDKVAPTLVALQKPLEIAPKSQITSSVLTADDHPTAVRKTQLRALILAVSFGLLFFAMVIAIIDSLLRRRRNRGPLAGRAARITDPELKEESGGLQDSDVSLRRNRRIGLNNPNTKDRPISMGLGQPSSSEKQRWQNRTDP